MDKRLLAWRRALFPHPRNPRSLPHPRKLD